MSPSIVTLNSDPCEGYSIPNGSTRSLNAHNVDCETRLNCLICGEDISDLPDRAKVGPCLYRHMRNCLMDRISQGNLECPYCSVDFSQGFEPKGAVWHVVKCCKKSASMQETPPSSSTDSLTAGGDVS